MHRMAVRRPPRANSKYAQMESTSSDEKRSPVSERGDGIYTLMMRESIRRRRRSEHTRFTTKYLFNVRREFASFVFSPLFFFFFFAFIHFSKCTRARSTRCHTVCMPNAKHIYVMTVHEARFIYVCAAISDHFLMTCMLLGEQ